MWRIKAFRKDLAEKFWIFIAWRLPKPLVAWATARLGAHATQGEYSNQVVPELTVIDGLKRWDTA